ncbi:MAG: response regulator [Spirochaetales bacterium]|nr:response regulator [Spirochaetales bacterium]
MTTKKFDTKRERAFQDETRERIARDTRRGVLVTLFMYPVFIPLDYVVYPTLAPIFMWIRFAVVALSIGVHFLMRLSFPQKHPRIFGMFAYLYCSYAILLMVHLAEGYMSPYYAGVNLVLLCLLFIVPMDVKETAVVVILIYAGYVIPILYQGNIQNLAAFVGNNFFVVSTMLLVVFSSQLANIMRRREFSARYELANANEELQELDVVKSQFFASVSHEIRTPLTSILAPTDSLRRGDLGAMTPAQKSLVNQVHRNAIRLLDLINQMLDFAKFDAGKMQLRLKRVDMARIVKNQASLFQEVCKRKGLFLDFEIFGSIPVVFLDQEKVERILSNLIRNAVKFTEQGGICVSLLLDEGDDPQWMTVKVQDSGIGIASEDFHKVFENFRQVDGSMTRRYDGTGLGLAIVRESVELQHGRIDLESEEGVGSTFSIRLPLHLDEWEPDAEIDRRGMDRRQEDKAYAGEDRRTTSRRKGDADKISLRDLALIEAESIPEDEVIMEDFPQNQSSTGIQVLYVEDNADLRTYVSRMLDSLGHQVTVASNGLDGWNQVQEHHPDIVVSDVMMPGMNGFQLVEKIKTTTDTQKIPIVLITAKSEAESRIEGLTIGADDYMGKPINLRELDARIKNIVNERQFRDALTRAEEKEELCQQLAYGFSQSLELRDGYTAGHSDDVLRYGTIITEELGIPMEPALYYSLLLHDIGKLGIPDSMLKKPAPLTPEEWTVMRTHPELGAQLLSRFDALSDMSEVVWSHHERFDGTGYPRGLAGEDIPLAARIISIADSWHAMREDRTYRKALPLEICVEELTKNRGLQFDPMIVDRFLLALVKTGEVPAELVPGSS